MIYLADGHQLLVRAPSSDFDVANLFGSAGDVLPGSL